MSSLLELTIATTLFTVLMSGLFAVMHPAQGAFATASDVADVQQRLRIAVDSLSKDLIAAGAGSYMGAHAGPLLRYFAPVRPIRAGTTSDAVSILFVRSTAVQTTLSAELPTDGEILRVANDPGCRVGADVCGVAAGMTLLVYDETGNADTFTVIDVAHDHALVRITSRPIGAPRPVYRVGSKVVEAEARTYSRRTITSPLSDQLVRNDTPVVEHLVGLTFQYFAEPEPPTLTPEGATYGPTPPAFLVQATGYPPGENCTFQVDASGPTHVPRLPALNASGALVELAPDQLADGPWCPDQADVNRWDADLLRIRKVGITVRVEAALPSLRGPAGPIFTNGGTSRSGAWVPDRELYWEVTPRNLNLAR